MAIRSETVRAIRERADIVEVIGRRVSLQARGKRFLGLCPFHSEKTPSFSVSREKGLYYCFGCHASGDVFTFVKEIEGLDFPSAVRSVAREVGIELEAESPEEAAKRKRLHAVARTNDYAHAYFETELWGENGARARDYLRERGIPERQARARRLGFGGLPGGLTAYLEAKNVPTRLQVEAGLLSDNGRVLFEERLLFPIRDAQERTVGFGGRRLGDGPGPKYINTREGPLFSKRALLYGWDVARESIRREKRAVLVEGYTDVLALQRASVNEAVASLGTAFTDEHAKLLARFAEEVIVVLDGDQAGEAASREATERLLRAELKVTVVSLPAGEDPDTFVRSRSVDDVRRSFENRRAALEVFVERAFEGHDNSIEARVEAAASLAPLFFAMPRGLQRDLYQARIAERVGVTVEQLERHLRRNAPRAQRRPQELASVDAPAVDEAPSREPEPPWSRPDVSTLRELLLYPKLRPRFGELAEFAPKRLSSVLDALASDEGSIDEVLVRLVLDPRALTELQTVAPYVGDDIDEGAERTFREVLSTLKARYLDATRENARQALEDALARGEDTRDLERQIKDLTRTVRRLKRADHQRSW
ncbi:MAG: DNA primase [Myxococcota bacterium]